MKRPRDTDDELHDEMDADGGIERKNDDHEDDDDGEDSCYCECEGDGCDEGEDSVGDEDTRHWEDDNTAIDIEKVRQGFAKLKCSMRIENSPSFQRFLTYLCPQPLDLGSLDNECMQIYEEEKSKAKHTLNNMGQSIALSVELFTYYNNRTWHNFDFVCLAAHFIDDTWELKKWLLCFRPYDIFKFGFMDAVILKTLNDWNLEYKVSSLTSRSANASNEVVESITGQIKEKKRLRLDSCPFSVSCCAEMFGSMAEDGFKEISTTICLEAWRCEHIWHITLWKLKNFLELESQEEFNSEFERESADEREKVQIVCRLLERVYNVAKLLFETKYPTANKFLYNLQELRENLILESTSSVSFASSLAKKMLQRLEKYIKDTFLVLGIASVMDPRCKMQYIEYISTKFEDRDGSFQSGVVLEAIRSIYADYVSHGIERKSYEGSSNHKSEEGKPGSDKERFQNFPGLQEYCQFVQAKNQPEKSDLDSYLEEPVLPWKENFNVLRWWKSEAPKYPTISKIARDFLAIPISVAISTDAYYLENRPADLQLINSGPDLMNALACCRSWSNERI